MCLILARHCTTVFDESQDSSLDFDSDLTARGFFRAEQLAGMLLDFPVHSILCSDLRRAVESAEPWARATRVELMKTDLLQPWSRPGLRGLREDLAASLVASAVKDPDRQLVGGGETFREYTQRTLRLLWPLIENYTYFGVVAHSTTVRFIESLITSADYLTLDPLEPGHAAIVRPTEFHRLDL